MGTLISKNDDYSHKEALKDALRELLHDEPALFRDLLAYATGKNELVEPAFPERAAVGNNTDVVTDAEFDHFLTANFKRFDATFRALA